METSIVCAEADFKILLTNRICPSAGRTLDRKWMKVRMSVTVRWDDTERCVGIVEREG